MAIQTYQSDPQIDGTSDSSERSAGTKIFLTLLTVVALFYGVILTYHVRHPMTVAEVEDPDFLEMCRQYCAKYGLVSTGDLKADAEAYLEAVDSQKLSASLQELLSANDFQPAATEDHPLIGKPASDFTLSDRAAITDDAGRRVAGLGETRKQHG